ncbi:MAG: LD-carboxypeptidase [Terracidiphilus sp.]|nr:LD-carboxypeptidase [Terracidiphilus sp.]
MKPRAVHRDAGISLISPASYALDERVESGTTALSRLGFVPSLGENARARGPLYFGGTAAERLSDLHAAFADTATDAVMCLRGGYGSNYLLDGLDVERIAEHPKPLFGYSDLTGVQLHLLDQIGLPAFHGPMAAADFSLEDGVHLASFYSTLEGSLYGVGAEEGLRTLKPGTARGTLYGGCLSILCALMGTPWEPQTEGKLLFLEDVGERPYRVDRMLWQLRRAGKFEGVRGFVFGEMMDCGEPDALEESILAALDGIDAPVGFGLRSGHVSRQNVTLTFGVEAELTLGTESRLELREAAVE